MAKKKQPQSKSGKKKAAAQSVPEADLNDVFDDPGPTRAVPAVDGDDEPVEAAPDDVHDDPGPTRTLPLARGADPMDDLPTAVLPSSEVRDEIEVAMALGRIDESKTPQVKKPKKR